MLLSAHKNKKKMRYNKNIKKKSITYQENLRNRIIKLVFSN